MKTFSQIATDAIAILDRLNARQNPTRSQLHYAVKQALRRDGVRNPSARLVLPAVDALEHVLAYDRACAYGCSSFVTTDDRCDPCNAAAVPSHVAEESATEPTKVDAALDLRCRS